MAIQANLIFRSGVLSGEVKELNGDLLRIGRDPANDFVVDDIEVSRNHAKITCLEGVFKIEDLNSTNGTLLNGRKISNPERLEDGDLISLGETNVFEFSLAKEPVTIDEPQARNKEKLEKEVNKSFFPIKKTESVFENPEDTDAPKIEKVEFFNGLSKLPTWAVVLIIALGFLILFCIIPWFFIEITNQWCNLFSGFFNAISPGICL